MSKEKFQIPEVPCQIKELNLSCYGCCGRDFGSKKQVEKDLELNTILFKKYFKKHPTRYKMMQFRDRISDNPDDLLPSGLCSNVVKFDTGCIACPLHPMINEIVDKEEYNFPFNKKKHKFQKKDPRFNYCDVNYECATFKEFKKFSDEQKIEFVKWVKKNNYKEYEYSMENGDNILIHKFLNKNKF